MSPVPRGHAAQFDPTMHCPHAGITGADTCSGPVESGAQDDARASVTCPRALRSQYASGAASTRAPSPSQTNPRASRMRKERARTFSIRPRAGRTRPERDTLNCRELPLGCRVRRSATATAGPRERQGRMPKLRPNNGIFGDTLALRRKSMPAQTRNDLAAPMARRRRRR